MINDMVGTEEVSGVVDSWFSWLAKGEELHLIPVVSWLNQTIFK
jgi:hypothetical protein